MIVIPDHVQRHLKDLGGIIPVTMLILTVYTITMPNTITRAYAGISSKVT